MELSLILASESDTVLAKSEVSKETVIFRWKVEDFLLLRDLIPLWLHSSDESEGLPEDYAIYSPVYVDSVGAEWWLRFYPYETRYNDRGSISIFIHSDRTQKEAVVIDAQIIICDRFHTPLNQKISNIKMKPLQRKLHLSNVGIANIVTSECIEKEKKTISDINIICELTIYSCKRNASHLGAHKQY